MTALPTGTVTFLFTDIEGSTRLLARLGERYADVLAAHHRVIRDALREHGGREVHTEGDAFFAVFARARDGVASAVQAQRALAAEGWPGGVQLRVRMGLHTGEAAVRDGDYVGLDVHRAARICSAGHGGQVLLSCATRELAGDDLPPGVALRGLGEHRLKDFDRPDELFQVVAGDLPSEFPPVSGGGAAAIPLPPNRTIGRERDLHALATRLSGGEVRLLTLTGPGGVGKTRLALDAARAASAHFRDGARFVSLAAVREPDDVPGAIVAALAITLATGESAAEAVLRFMSAKRMLLVLDNFEQVLSAAGLLTGMLAAAPSVTILATSREPLALQAEERFRSGRWRCPQRPTYEGGGRCGRRCAVLRARAGGRRFRPECRGPACGGGDLPAAGRAAAGHRAGRRALRTLVPGGDRRSPGRRTRSPWRRPARCPGPAAHAPRDDRLEP
jgi:class 3 adenylate cyclase